MFREIVIGTDWASAVPYAHKKFVCSQKEIVRAVKDGNYQYAEALVYEKTNKKLIAKDLRVVFVRTHQPFYIIADPSGKEHIEYVNASVIVLE